MPSRICANCVLPETFPRIRFDKEGVCNYCRGSQDKGSREKKAADYRRKFDSLVSEYKGKSGYDALMCYSGGKDSTYTLAVLREKYGLKVLALTLDNGFVSNQASQNIRSVVEKLGVDHIFFKPSFHLLAKIFRTCATRDIFPPKTLERASTICTSCMAILKSSALRLALEKDIPFIAFGWSPGQAPIASSIMRNNPEMVRMMQKTLFDPLYKIAGDDLRPYFLEERHFSGDYRFPYNIHPLAFMEYSEDDIYKDISRFGWKAPEDVDANSTNCLLNSFANIVHVNRFGFHPYASELANLVREGYMDRSSALEKLRQMENPGATALAKERLGLA
jgi:tRNA(Ile)-lysidine synthase TilS/MesJ